MLSVEGARLIDPTQGLDDYKDLLIKDGKIEAIESPGAFRSLDLEERISAEEMWVMPGFIDLHVHLREPGFEWKETIETGSKAAVYGGYTSVCCMPNTQPAIHSVEIVEFIKDRAKQIGLCRVLPIGAITFDRAGKELTPIAELREAGCVAFSDDGDPVFNALVMRRALEWSRELGVAMSCHEEDKDLACGGCMNESALSVKLGLVGMPKVAEEVMIARDIELARTTGGHVHICHVSSGRGVELIRRAKNDGIKITCEVTPHHLVLTEEAIQEHLSYAKMSPPLREEEERQLLIHGLRDGTIDAIASDHAPHEEDSKQKEFAQAAMGILGLQTSFPLLLEFVEQGLLDRMQLVDRLSSAPARVFGMELGTLRKGAVADVVIADPKEKWTFLKTELLSKSLNSPFLGKTMTGKVCKVMVGGRLVWQQREGNARN